MNLEEIKEHVLAGKKVRLCNWPPGEFIVKLVNSDYCICERDGPQGIVNDVFSGDCHFPEWLNGPWELFEETPEKEMPKQKIPKQKMWVFNNPQGTLRWFCNSAKLQAYLEMYDRDDLILISGEECEYKLTTTTSMVITDMPE